MLHRQSTVLALATCSALVAGVSTASADPRFAVWRASNTPAFKVGGKAVCKRSSTVSVVDGGRCGGKAGAYEVLAAKDGYSLMGSGERIPGHVAIDEASDYGLCLGTFKNGGTTKLQVPGVIRRGTQSCAALVGTKKQSTSDFSYIVKGADDLDMIGQGTFDQGNGWFKRQADHGKWVPFNAFMIGKGQYLCSQQSTNDAWVGVTWVGDPPALNQTHGHYCKVLVPINGDMQEFHVAKDAYNIFLNQQNSHDRKGRFWLSWSSGGGEDLELLPMKDDWQICKAGSKLGLAAPGGACQHAGGTSSTTFNRLFRLRHM